jgi:ATP-binding cassette subfamily F protein 3
MDDMEDLQQESTLAFKFNYSDTPAKVLLRAENLGFGYNPDEPLFQGVTFALEKGQRLAIIGKNGKGKSTLLNYIASELPHQQGTLEFHPSTKFAHFGQTNIERLDVKATIIDEISSVSKDIGFAEVRGICGRMMFSGDLAEKKIEVLSGGERSRVMLGKIIGTPANLLFLDEPTNHLDMQSIDALADAIEAFEGSLIMVTHSEMLLRRLADALIIFHKGGAEYFNGTYDEFLEKIGWEEEEGSEPKIKKVKINHKERKQLRKAVTQERNEARRPYTKEIKLCEEKLEVVEAKLAAKNEELEKVSILADNVAIMALSKEVGLLQQEVDSWFERLEIATQKDDEIVAKYELRLEDIDA